MVSGMVRWACVAVLTGLLGAAIARRDPLTLEAPATVLSHCLPAQKASEPFLLFLRSIRRTVPPGATIALRTPEAPNIGPTYLIAVGQLPEHDVWPVFLQGTEESPVLAEWVACFFTDFHDPRYLRVESLENGSLLRRLP